jgi:hypothetical protein
MLLTSSVWPFSNCREEMPSTHPASFHGSLSFDFGDLLIVQRRGHLAAFEVGPDSGYTRALATIISASGVVRVREMANLS